MPGGAEEAPPTWFSLRLSSDGDQVMPFAPPNQYWVRAALSILAFGRKKQAIAYRTILAWGFLVFSPTVKQGLR